MYVYWWYETELELIKIGVGKDPAQRMREYSKTWNLTADEQTLVQHAVPDGIDAQEIERFLHNRIMKAGHRMVRIGAANTQGTANEMFHTKKRDRETIDRFLERELKRFVSLMAEEITMERPTATMDTVINEFYARESPWPEQRITWPGKKRT